MSANADNNRNALRVMIVGPGRETEGGITEVISRVISRLEAHSDIEPHWVVTHKSAGAVAKVLIALKGYFQALIMMPRVDIVHVHSAAYVSFKRKSLIFWIARIWGRPVIWHLHTPNSDFSDFFGKSGLVGGYARYVCSKVDRVVVLSESWRSIVAPYIDSEKVRVILNPIPDLGSEEREDIQRDSTRILYLAHLIKRKGYPHLIIAFAEIVKKFPGCKLIFAGSGEVDEAKVMCRSLGIEDKVEFLGWINSQQRARQLRGAGIFVLPSYQEGLPMGVLEAMASGLAVVTTPVGGIGDVVVHGKNGILVSPGDERQLADALLELLHDPVRCRQLGKQAIEDVRLFTPELICEHWVRLYFETLASCEQRKVA